MVTALGFDFFARSGVEVAVIETGLGGRLDATNVLRPTLTIVTDISFDHVEILGHTLTKIAREKAGIIKPAVPHLIGLLPPQAERVMVEFCRRRHTNLHKLNMRRAVFHPSEFAVDYETSQFRVKGLKPALVGLHQLKNTVLALEAIALLKKSGVRIDRPAIVEGISNTYWPGRFQTIKHSGEPTVILDVCHNRAGVKAFVETFQARYPGRKAAIIVGVVKKKEHQAMFDALAPIAKEYALVPLKTHRSTSPKELVKTVEFQGTPVRKFGSLTTARSAVVKTSARGDIILVVGSHYLVGEYLKTYGWS